MANKDLPIYEKHETFSPVSTPNFASAFEENAQANNGLSQIGAHVAQVASQESAKILGYQQGLDPHGDLSLPPITDFDKTFADSYHTQAASTLSLKGQKLLDDVHIEISKSPRITPQLIANAREQLSKGLTKIANDAPIAIKGKLQETFDSQILNQTTQYQTKMISEQREDQKNNIINALDSNTQKALEAATNGDFKIADDLVKDSKKMADSAYNSRFISPEQARTAHESVQQAAINGKYINQAMKAYKENKYSEFEKNYADNKPAGMTNEQWVSAGQAFKQRIGFIDTLKSQEESIKSQQMLNQIATDPNSITGNQWQEFANSVSTLKAEEVRFKYIQALKSQRAGTVSSDALIQNFSNPEAWANSSEKNQNEAFNRNVAYTMQNSQHKLPLIKPLSHEDAQVQVAASAGGVSQVFTKDLKNKLSSANPAFIESAAQQIHSLQEMGAGHALKGLSDQDHALYTMYEAFRNSMDPMTAAREATNAVLNQDPATQQMNKQKWSNLITTSTQGGVALTDFALTAVGMNKASFINPSMAQVYGTDILNKYKGYYQLTNGDNASALKMTKKFVDDNYGDTGVNGGSHKTLHPLEKVLGFQNKDGVPYIQHDAINQFNEKLVPIKKAYDEKKTNEYWETLPISGKDKGIFRSDFDPIKVKRHLRTEKGEKVDLFNVVLHGNSFDSWDVAIETGSGMRNLFQVAPFLGIMNYKPNAEAIRAHYNKDHPLK